jgi:hypothetical protein
VVAKSPTVTPMSSVPGLARSSATMSGDRSIPCTRTPPAGRGRQATRPDAELERAPVPRQLGQEPHRGTDHLRLEQLRPPGLGQVPIYYNHEPTGRPRDPAQNYVSRHRDIPSCSPLFAFGHGLSYATFEVTDLRLSSSTVSRQGSLQASVTVTNTGRRKGDEVVQLYLHDPVASISQPVRRLCGFERVTLDLGRSRTVTFALDKSDFGFYDNRGKFAHDAGSVPGVFAAGGIGHGWSSGSPWPSATPG